MPIPNKIKCPICGSEMQEIPSRSNFKVGLAVRIPNEELKIMESTIFQCFNCDNTQVFTNWSPADSSVHS